MHRPADLQLELTLTDAQIYWLTARPYTDQNLLSDKQTLHRLSDLRNIQI